MKSMTIRVKRRVRSPSKPTTVMGVDACSVGWIAVVLHEGAFAQAVVAPRFRERPLAVGDERSAPP
jgi:hypothetical protein